MFYSERGEDGDRAEQALDGQLRRHPSRLPEPEGVFPPAIHREELCRTGRVPHDLLPTDDDAVVPVAPDFGREANLQAIARASHRVCPGLQVDGFDEEVCPG